MADGYALQFDKITSLVPRSNRLTSANPMAHLEYYGEVLSGAPIIPIPKEEPARAAALAQIKQAAFKDSEDFATLADGYRHGHLMREWARGGPGALTSCNAFVGYVTKAIGLRGLGGFNVEKILAKQGKQHCWITPSSGETPQYGDLFETRSITPGLGYENLHVGFSLTVEDGNWMTIEGGQGGPVAGCDKIARIKKKYRTEHLLGWIDMRLLISGKSAIPSWLTGNWMIKSGSEDYVYSFDRYGTVKQKAYHSPSVPAAAVPDRDTGSLIYISSDLVKVDWKGEVGIETFTYDRWNSFAGLNERMTGKAADGSAMTGVRL